MGKTTGRDGNYAELRVIADLIKRGYSVSIPFGHENRYDLILDKDGSLFRVQVKSARMVCGAVVVPTCSTNSARTAAYTSREIDYLAAYEPATDKVYYVSIDDTGDAKWRIYLRVDDAKNNQSFGVRYAKDYTEI